MKLNIAERVHILTPDEHKYFKRALARESRKPAPQVALRPWNELFAEAAQLVKPTTQRKAGRRVNPE